MKGTKIRPLVSTRPAVRYRGSASKTFLAPLVFDHFEKREGKGSKTNFVKRMQEAVFLLLRVTLVAWGEGDNVILLEVISLLIFWGIFIKIGCVGPGPPWRKPQKKNPCNFSSKSVAFQ